MPTSPAPARYKKRAIPCASRRALAERYGCQPGQNIAAYCPCGAPGKIHWFPLTNGRAGSWVAFSGLEIDHIIPEFRGGTSDPENLTLLCRRCNRSKGAKV
jgi:hypothetical protein